MIPSRTFYVLRQRKEEKYDMLKIIQTATGSNAK